MSDTPKHITFIGRASATAGERDALEYLGRILAAENTKLITNPKGDSNIAIAQGYCDKGGVPLVLDKNVLDHATDGLVIFADDDLIKALDKRDLAWRARYPSATAVLMTTDQLYKFVDFALAVAQEKLGTTIDPW